MTVNYKSPYTPQKRTLANVCTCVNVNKYIGTDIHVCPYRTVVSDLANKNSDGSSKAPCHYRQTQNTEKPKGHLGHNTESLRKNLPVLKRWS